MWLNVVAPQAGEILRLSNSPGENFQYSCDSEGSVHLRSGCAGGCNDCAHDETISTVCVPNEMLFPEIGTQYHTIDCGQRVATADVPFTRAVHIYSFDWPNNDCYGQWATVNVGGVGRYAQDSHQQSGPERYRFADWWQDQQVEHPWVYNMTESNAVGACRDSMSQPALLSSRTGGDTVRLTQNERGDLDFQVQVDGQFTLADGESVRTHKWWGVHIPVNAVEGSDWVHVVVTLAGAGAMEAYVDGVPVAFEHLSRRVDAPGIGCDCPVIYTREYDGRNSRFVDVADGYRGCTDSEKLINGCGLANLARAVTRTMNYLGAQFTAKIDDLWIQPSVVTSSDLAVMFAKRTAGRQLRSFSEQQFGGGVLVVRSTTRLDGDDVVGTNSTAQCHASLSRTSEASLQNIDLQCCSDAAVPDSDFIHRTTCSLWTKTVCEATPATALDAVDMCRGLGSRLCTTAEIRLCAAQSCEATATSWNHTYLPSLQGYWSFENRSTPGSVALNDQSGTARVAELTGLGDADWVEGVAGFALRFNASESYAVKASARGLPSTSARTLMGWVRTRDSPRGGSWSRLFGYEGSNATSNATSFVVGYQDSSFHDDDLCPVTRAMCTAATDLPDNCDCGDCGHPQCGDCDCDQYGEQCCTAHHGGYFLETSTRHFFGVRARAETWQHVAVSVEVVGDHRLLKAYVDGALVEEYGYGYVAQICRADICGDGDEDCCAPGDEARACKEDGYTVTPGGTSSRDSCVSEYGEGAVYQCCIQGPETTGLFDNEFFYIGNQQVSPQLNQSRAVAIDDVASFDSILPAEGIMAIYRAGLEGRGITNGVAWEREIASAVWSADRCPVAPNVRAQVISDTSGSAFVAAFQSVLDNVTDSVRPTLQLASAAIQVQSNLSIVTADYSQTHYVQMDEYGNPSLRIDGGRWVTIEGLYSRQLGTIELTRLGARFTVLGGESPQGSRLTLRGLKISRQSGREGGVVNIYGGGLVVLRCELSHNAVTNRGAAIYAASGSVIIEGSDIFDNEALVEGGAVCSEYSALHITDSTFDRNCAKLLYGGALSISWTMLSMFRTELRDNQACGTGGAIQMGTSDAVDYSPQVVDCTFERNMAVIDHDTTGIDIGSLVYPAVVNNLATRFALVRTSPPVGCDSAGSDVCAVGECDEVFANAETGGACPAGEEQSPLGGCRHCEPWEKCGLISGRTCKLTSCADKNGGCDLLTVCSESKGLASCGPCPSGYDGDGRSGCMRRTMCNVDNGGCGNAECIPLANGTGTVCSTRCMHGSIGQGPSDCKKCPAGFYETVGECVKCTDGMQCGVVGFAEEGISYPAASPGWWISDDDPSTLSKCAGGEVIGKASCPGGIEQCGHGARGVACSQCSCGFYRLNKKCTQCPTVSPLIYVFIGVLAILLFGPAIAWTMAGMDQLGSVFGPSLILVNFAQLMRVYSDINLKW